MNMNSLLESLYKNDLDSSRLEKTAETKMLNNLQQGQQVDNPYMEMSTDELIKLAQEIEREENVETHLTEDSQELEKTAFEMLGGQVMAHALVHELDLMKIAMANGLCRVCKSNHMDIEASTICSECSASGGE